jgi:putative heme-binding domain-containing protein
VDGFGRQGGPDLTTIHERGEEHILRSVLDPGAEVAPQYEPWQLTLTDRSEKIGFLLGQEGGKSIFADISGNEFEIDYREIVKRRQIAVSLMPPGLFNLMADGEIADLLFWLSRKR